MESCNVLMLSELRQRGPRAGASGTRYQAVISALSGRYRSRYRIVIESLSIALVQGVIKRDNGFHVTAIR